MHLITNPYRVRDADIHNGSLTTKVQRVRRHRRLSLVVAVVIVFLSFLVPFEVGPIAITFVVALVLVVGWHFLLSSGETSVNAYGKVFPELVDHGGHS